MSDGLIQLLTSASDEVSDVAYRIYADGWKTQMLSVAEEALGIAAYYCWKFDPCQANDPTYFEYPNVSARASALFIVSQIGRLPEVMKAIRLRHSEFDPEREVMLAGLRLPSTHTEWGETVTRSVILLTRSLAYCQTECVDRRRLAFQNTFDESMERRLAVFRCEYALGPSATVAMFGTSDSENAISPNEPERRNLDGLGETANQLGKAMGGAAAIGGAAVFGLGGLVAGTLAGLFGNKKQK
jgi:hypothetical protein